MFKRKSPKPKVAPQLIVKEVGGKEISSHELIDNSYLVGSNREECQIVIEKKSVSGVHLSIRKDLIRGHGFIILDEGSTNGVYKGEKEIKKAILYHGDTFTLGKPNLGEVVSISYKNLPSLRKKLFKISLYSFSGLMSFGLLVFFIETSKVDISNITSATGPVKIYAENDLQAEKILYQARGVTYDKNSDYSSWIHKALIAKEDQRFYWHPGIDPIGIFRAAVKNLFDKKKTQGASTISQQLAGVAFKKYVFTGRGDNEYISRKDLEEAEQKFRNQRDEGTKLRQTLLALKLDATYSKDAILTSYMNRVFIADNRYGGFEDAAQRYFHVSAKDLSLAQSALLVGILPRPSEWNPCVKKENIKKVKEPINARIQQIIVLQRMLEAELINDSQVEKVTGWKTSLRNLKIAEIKKIVAGEENISEKLYLKSGACDQVKIKERQNLFDYVINQELKELKEILGEKISSKGDIAIETGLNLEMQGKAEAALQKTIKEGTKKGFKQGAIVTIDSRTGLIKAMVGGVPPNENEINRATRSFLQSGSTFKLFTYATALEKGISANKLYSCERMPWEGYDRGGCKHATGSINMFTGFALSENITALRIAKEVGIEQIQNTARNMGIESKIEDGPAMVLGSSDTNVLEMTGAYSSVAAKGIWSKPHAILRLYDTSTCQDKNKVNTCRVIYDATKNPPASRQAIKPEVADTLTTLMRGVVSMPEATGRNAVIKNMNAVGKTGTTDNNQSSWFIGFVMGKPEVTAVWLGDDTRGKGISGSSSDAAQAWSNYMFAILKPVNSPSSK